MLQSTEFGTSPFVAALPRLNKWFTPAILKRCDEAQRSLTLLQQRFNIFV
jgi:hypothetical protein